MSTQGSKTTSRAACPDCVTNSRGAVIKQCGPCEERSIQERISWWQSGKAALRETEKKNRERFAHVRNDGCRRPPRRKDVKTTKR